VLDGSTVVTRQRDRSTKQLRCFCIVIFFSSGKIFYYSSSQPENIAITPDIPIANIYIYIYSKIVDIER